MLKKRTKQHHTYTHTHNTFLNIFTFDGLTPFLLRHISLSILQKNRIREHVKRISHFILDEKAMQIQYLSKYTPTKDIKTQKSKNNALLKFEKKKKILNEY